MALIDTNWRLFFFVIISTAICVTRSSPSNQTSNDWNFAKEFEKIEINRHCDVNSNCSHNTLCVDNQCQCRPDHKWNPREHRCESYDCLTNRTECQTYDPHRECRHALPTYFIGKCECAHHYLEDRRNLKCRKHCYNNEDCNPGLKYIGADNNLVCVDFMCHCRPNTRWNAATNQCQAFNCTKDAECWTGGDENRECVDGVCQCNFQEDMVSTKCYLTLYSLFRIRNYSTRKERLLLLSLFIMPSVMLYCLYSQMKKQKVSKTIAKNIENSQTGLNYIYMTKTQQMKTTKI